MKQKPAPGRTILSLQYLRAIAALLVVYFHAELQAPGRAVAFPSFGAAGVDIFFVLSGYVMWLTTSGRQLGPLQFMQRRIIRIVPLYWLISLVAVGFSLTAPGIMRSTKFEPTHFLASLFFIPWPNPASATHQTQVLTPLLVPGWTLNMEMFFYLLFALLLPFGVRWRLMGLMLMICVAFIIGTFFAGRNTPLSFYGTTLLFEFWFGMVLAAVVGKQSDSPILIPHIGQTVIFAMLWLAALTALLLADWYNAGEPKMIWYGLPALSVVGIAILAERRGLVACLPWLQTLGDASYSLYLTHGFVVAACRVLFAQLPFLSSIDHPLPFIGIVIMGSILVGLATYFLVEKPLTLFVGQFASRKGQPTITATA
ncbi:acyltransferase family protein [Sphingomonas sp. IW22]|uniref:acyltransferase family protein n=1 Tax=Sphingomonas sp. IW22 TaxID=3242489 RepID=UPI0035220F73